MQNRLKRLIKESLDFSSFKMNKQLNPTIWTKNKMNEDISDALLQIAKDYFISLNLNIPVKDILMTGSLANYNWSKYSDIDLHVLINIDKFKDNKELFKELIDSKTRAWNDNHDIKIKGYDVELYMQDINEPHHSTGVYSILNNKWIVEPKIQDDSMDKKTITRKYNNIVNSVNDSIKEFKSDDDHDKLIETLNKIKDKIKKMRKKGLEGAGEYSSENIIFKLLRRNDIMKKINDIINKTYDDSMSIDEMFINSINEEEF